MIHSVGIIGLGSFGTFVAKLFPQDIKVIGYDPQQTNSNVQQDDFDSVIDTDAVILAIPLSAYKDMLPRIKPVLKPQTLLIDICSVKVKPDELISKHLPGHPNLLITHPLFGPETAAPDKTEGHNLIVTKSIGEKAERTLTYCKEQLGLTIHHMSPTEHDKAMAHVHALTFFVARSLARANITKTPFQTPSFQMILDLVELDQKHSEELFRTIEQGNPYASQVRRNLLQSFERTSADLGDVA